MKPEVEKALELLTQLTGLMKLNRAEHFEVQEALKLIEQELNTDVNK